jgi:hypothetical protein
MEVTVTNLGGSIRIVDNRDETETSTTTVLKDGVKISQFGDVCRITFKSGNWIDIQFDEVEVIGFTVSTIPSDSDEFYAALLAVMADYNGGTETSPYNFSFKTINEGVTIDIPTEQQMTVFGSMRVDGVLTVDGELILTDLDASTAPDLSGYVPYVGATTDVNIGTHSIVTSNGSKLRKGSLNNGFGGGISLECVAGYEAQWENGILYLFALGSPVVHAISINGSLPDSSFDDTKGYVAGSTIYIATTKDTYECSDNLTGAAVWVIRPNSDWSASGTSQEIVNKPSFQTPLGFTPENVANKSTSVNTDQASDTKYPSVKSVFDWASGIFTTASAVATQIATALSGYATQAWVNSQGFLTSITSGNVTTALGFTPVTNARTITINGTAQDLTANRTWTINEIVRSEYNTSAAAYLDIPIPVGYSHHKINFIDTFAQTANSELWFRVGTGSTPTIQAGASDYTHYRILGGVSNGLAMGGAATDSKVVIIGAAMPTGASGRTYSGCIEVYAPDNSSYNKHFTGVLAGKFNNGNFVGGTVSADYNANTAVTAIRFLCSTGNISGKFVIESYL